MNNPSIFRQKRDARLIGVLFLVVLLAMLSFPDRLMGQESPGEHKLDKEYAQRFGRDLGQVFFSPFHWKGRDFFTLSAVMSTGVLLFVLDKDIYLWSQENKTSASTNFFNFVTNFGDGAVLGPFLLASYLTGEVFNWDGLRKTALLGTESLIISTMMVYFLKFVVGRERPQDVVDTFEFKPFSGKNRFFSFPSGHSAAAFSVATVVAGTSKKIYVDLLAYGLAGLVAASRVHNSKHWVSDVFFGSMIGYFIGKKIVDLNRNTDSGRLQFGLQLSRQRQAFSLSYQF